MTMKLDERFGQIATEHKASIKRRCARITLGSSVVRVFEKNTKVDLLVALNGIPVGQLLHLRTPTSFQKWFKDKLGVVAGVIQKRNHGNGRLGKGLKWGHASKVLCLFLRELVECSHYFADDEARRIAELLYVPIDSVIIGRLREDEVPLTFDRIRGIGTEKAFFDVQKELGKAAHKTGVSRIWYDDAWAAR